MAHVARCVCVHSQSKAARPHRRRTRLGAASAGGAGEAGRDREGARGGAGACAGAPREPRHLHGGDLGAGEAVGQAVPRAAAGEPDELWHRGQAAADDRLRPPRRVRRLRAARGVLRHPRRLWPDVPVRLLEVDVAALPLRKLGRASVCSLYVLARPALHVAMARPVQVS
jgi:hypothetical protein